MATDIVAFCPLLARSCRFAAILKQSELAQKADINRSDETGRF